jgi:B12-binding domain/radical SAM domain protein
VTVRPTVIAFHARSGIAALNVVTAALEVDARTAGLDVRFVRTREALAAAIAAAPGPAVVAWSFYSPDFPRAAEAVAWARAHAPPALHVAGGVHASAEPAATLAAGFDLVAIGEGEATFVEIVAAVASGASPPRDMPGTAWLDATGALVRAPAAPRRPLDDFPAANLRFGRWNPIEITRGCIYACSFCQTPFLFKARFRHRSVADVRRHVRAMVADGGRYVRFVSPTSLSYGSADTAVNLVAVDELLAAVRAELPPGGKLYFGTFPSEVRPEHVTPAALAVIARHADNRSLVIGGQSGSERVLAATHRGHDVAAIVHAVDAAVAAGFRPDVDFLYGLPEEDAADRAATIALAEDLVARGARIHSHAFMPLPGTPLARATPTPIPDDVAGALARLEARGASYGQWRQQQVIAADLVRRRTPRPGRLD